MDVDAISTELLDALARNATIAPFSTRKQGFDREAAWQVSAEILRRRRDHGESPIGRKIGFTNRSIWPEYGVFTPIWAHVFDTTTTFLEQTEGTLAIGHLSQPRIEPEIVLHFGSAPPATTEDEAGVLSHVDWIAHGFEIVQTHFPGWKFEAADTIADFGLHGALVVGPRQSIAGMRDVARILREFSITLAKDGALVASGCGANVLGSPVMSAIHLLRLLRDQQRFQPIQAGEIVTTGTLTSACPIGAGETWSTQLSGIGLDGLRLHVE